MGPTACPVLSYLTLSLASLRFARCVYCHVPSRQRCPSVPCMLPSRQRGVRTRRHPGRYPRPRQGVRVSGSVRARGSALACHGADGTRLVPPDAFVSHLEEDRRAADVA